MALGFSEQVVGERYYDMKPLDIGAKRGGVVEVRDCRRANND